MDGLSLGAALASALLHAGWNAAVKAHAAPREAMVAQMSGAALLSIAGMLVTGVPPVVSWGWIALSTLMNVVAVTALLRAYESGGFGTVYPVMRALGVLCVALASPLLFGEAMGLGARFGVGLIVAALLLLVRQAGGGPNDEGGGAGSDFPPRAVGWTVLAGLFTGAYVLADAQGVRVAVAAGASPLGYGFGVSVANALAMGWISRGAGAPWTLLARHGRVALPSATAAMLSYLLILWVFTRAPIAPAAALRDTSAIFAMLIAVVWMKERLPPRRLLALALALAGVPLLRLG